MPKATQKNKTKSFSNTQKLYFGQNNNILQ